MKYAPVALFVYNRLDFVKLTLGALRLNKLAKKTILYIFSDGARIHEHTDKVKEVRTYLKSINPGLFKSIEIIEWENNLGLANSIIKGIDHVFTKHTAIIVLEDDLLTTDDFLGFMNKCLQWYCNVKAVKSINAFSPWNDSAKTDIYFQIRPFPWGWATWRDRWNTERILKMDNYSNLTPQQMNEISKKCGRDIPRMLNRLLLGKNNSWYVRWTVDHYLEKKVALYPKYSKIQNIGFEANATNCNSSVNAYTSKINSLNSIERPNYETKVISDVSNDFLQYFTPYHKIKFRLNLMFKEEGRTQLFAELKNKFLPK